MITSTTIIVTKITMIVTNIAVDGGGDNSDMMMSNVGRHHVSNGDSAIINAFSPSHRTRTMTIYILNCPSYICKSKC